MTRYFVVFSFICFFLGPSSVFAQARVLINRHTRESTFEATDQWKRVGENQPIPPGLHIRFNLTSNTVEAKKLDTNSRADPNTNVVAVTQDDLESGSFQAKQKGFRNYDEIKKSLKELKLVPKSELALMIELVNKAKRVLRAGDKYGEQDLLNILADLNDRVEQIDVGREFAKIGAIDDIIIASLNKSAEVKSSALLLLGSALQNNQPVQIAAYKAGLLIKLLALITSEKDAVLARAMFSLSALIRRLPIAQKTMIESGGAGLLIEVFDIHKPRIQSKILALIYDLLMEQEDANLTLQEASQNAATEIGKEELKHAIDKHNQYQSIKLAARFVEQGWCTRLSEYLHEIQGEHKRIYKDDECPNISQPEHDKVEKALNAMLALGHNCADDYKLQTNRLPCTIVHFQEQYKALEHCENKHQYEPDEEIAHYYRNLGERFEKLARIVGNGIPLQCRDEL